MTSSDSADSFDVERGIPTTAEDVAALRRARAAGSTDLASYLRFLAAFGPAPRETLLARKGPRGDEPFEL